MAKKTKCEFCNSSKIIKKPGYAEVQRICEETGEPIGEVTIFFIYICLSCGQEFYKDKVEEPIN